jgi:hypothetical protein
MKSNKTLIQMKKGVCTKAEQNIEVVG